MRLNLVCALALALAAGTAACGDDDAADGGGAADAGGGGGADAGGGGGADAGGGATCTTEMFEKYGEAAFLAVNQSIIEKSVAAPTSAVGTSFQDLAAQDPQRVEEFTNNLASFLVQVYGGPENYAGPSMEKAHEGLNITSEQYDYFITNVVVPALSENGVPQADIENCFAPPVVDQAFKNSIINR